MRETPRARAPFQNKTVQALYGFRRADIHANRSHRLIARIANRRVRGKPKSPLIAHKLLVGLKLIEADKVIRVRGLIDVADIRFVHPIFLGVQNEFGRFGILRVGAHGVNVLDVDVAAPIRIASAPQFAFELLVGGSILVGTRADSIVRIRVHHGGCCGRDGKHVGLHQIHEQLLRRTIHEGGDEQTGQDSHDQKEGENSRPEAH